MHERPKPKKPSVFNIVKAIEQIEAMQAENERLTSEVEKLRRERTNLEIRCRILEERLSNYDTKVYHR